MKPKDQGTRWESALVERFRTAGYKAWRLAEGGIKDSGDVAVEFAGPDYLVVEAKHRSNLNVHQTVEKMERKVAGGDLPFLPLGSVLCWKKSTRKAGNTVRSPDGVPDVVAMSWDMFMLLLKGLEDADG